MDVASDPNLVPIGGYRYVKNFRRNRDGRLVRASGWEKLFTERDPNNWDFHYQQGYVDQHITMLYEAEDENGFTKLFLGTQNRIHALNSESGNWSVVSDLYGGPAEEGCSEVRFDAASSGNFVFFTNGRDKPLYHVIDQPAIFSGGQAAEPLADFEILNIDRAKVVVSFNGTIIWMNLRQDGRWRHNRIIWSDYRRYLSYSPSNESIAGYYDLDDEDKILAAAATKNSILIYTNRGIWEMAPVGGEAVFGFSRRWTAEKPSGKGVLAFPNTLVATGDSHYYFGSDAIYQYSTYISEPTPVDWIYNATRDIFKEIDKARCRIHVGGYADDDNELMFSWARSTDDCPYSTVVINTRHQFVGFVDHGFSAFLSHNAYRQKTLRRVLLDYCICSLDELDDTPETQLLCGTEEEVVCDIVPASIYTATQITDDGITHEKFSGDADVDSLYSLWEAIDPSEFCGSEQAADVCNAQKVFIAASSVDMCLKQFTNVYYRERLNDAAGCGTYVRDGFRSILRSGAMDLRIPDDDKIISRFAAQHHPEESTIPGVIQLRIGSSAVAEDPNIAGGLCSILWDDQGVRTIECLGQKTAAAHRAAGTRPNTELEWGVYQVGRFIYFELEVYNPDDEDRGAPVGFSRFTFDAAACLRPAR